MLTYRVREHNKHANQENKKYENYKTIIRYVQQKELWEEAE